MRPDKASSVEELQVISRFESLRTILQTEDYTDHLDKPLAYWALPSDRRLPLAFLGRSLKDLLATPYVDLSATPGIGRKKIRSFVQLLARAANTNPAELPAETAPAVNHRPIAPTHKVSSNGNGFDPGSVSEVVWARWRTSVVKHGLADETLGRLAPTLRNMTRVIWNVPLGAYTDCTLAEIRGMKTHGEKRVRAIMEVFYSVHCLVAEMGSQTHLVVRIVPRLIDEVERWIGESLQTSGVPDDDEIFRELIHPLLQQVDLDATQQIARLAENRVGLSGPITSVRQAARTMGLTRARVYQLLNEINDIVTVRWPNGRHQVYELRDKYQSELDQAADPRELTQFNAAIELFYPGSRRGAAGPLEQAPMMEEVRSQLIEA